MVIPRTALGEQRPRGREVSNEHVWCAGGASTGKTRTTRSCLMVAEPMERELSRDVLIKRGKLDEVLLPRCGAFCLQNQHWLLKVRLPPTGGDTLPCHSLLCLGL